MTPKTAKAEKMKPEQQRAAFEATARELGCDESPGAFEAAVKKVARHKPVEEKPEIKVTAKSGDIS